MLRLFYGARLALHRAESAGAGLGERSMGMPQFALCGHLGKDPIKNSTRRAEQARGLCRQLQKGDCIERPPC